MPELQSIALRGSEPAAFAHVTCRVVGEGGDPLLEPAYAPGGSIIAPIRVTADADGAWSVELPGNSTLLPSGTVWQIVQATTDTAVASLVLMPATGGPYDLEDVLADAPGALPDGALSAHLTDPSDAHDASAVSFTPVGTVQATDVQAAIAEVAAEGGAGASQPFEHVQSSPSASWVVTHNRGHYPLVDVLDAGGELVITDVAHNSVNQATLTFAAPATGRALFI